MRISHNRGVKMGLEGLPDVLILNIFQYLPIKDRCLAGRVCRRWRRIVNDNSLWRHVDLTPYRLNLKKTWKVLRSHFSECLLTVKFRGYIDNPKPNWKQQTLSNAQLEDLRDRCPNLKELHLYSVNLEKIDADKLPRSLVKLTTYGCQWPPGWLKTTQLPHLQYLDVSKTSRIDKTEVLDFCKFSTLEELLLGNCYRVTENCIKAVVENLPLLKKCILADTKCTDLALHHLSRNLQHLEHLDLRDCSDVTDGGVDTVAMGMKTLCHLDVSRCVKLTDNCLKPIHKLLNLRTLVCGPGISEAAIEEFEIKAPRIKLIKCQPLRYESEFY